jgi:hypothetical protein
VAKHRSKRSIVFILAALFALFGATLANASARTYHHGKTVWFSDVTIADGDVVKGDLDIVFGSVVCEDGGEIDGNVKTFFGSFNARDGCQVDGRVNDVFSNNALTGDGALGFLPALAPPSSDDFLTENRRILKKFAWDVVVVFAFLLFPLRVRVALDRVEKHPGLSFAAGAVAVVACVPIGVLLLLSIIGIPLIPLEFAALFAGLWIGNAAVALLVGRRLYELLRPHTTPSPLGALVLGLIVVTAAETLPVVGWAVAALVALVGLGAALLAFVRETSFHAFTNPAMSGGTPQPPMRMS